MDNTLTTENNKRPYNLGEEIANSITHGIGAGLAIAALVILVVSAARLGDPWRVVSFSIYGASLILMYLASTLYHALHHAGAKHVFKILDHSAIYLLIAGTYTPFTLVSLRGAWGWTLFGIIWGLAITGIVFKAIFIEKNKKLSLVIYILMGWLIIIAIRPMLATVALGGMLWLAAGGVLYTGGVIFYRLKSIKYMHAVWHLFVLGGSICHFFAILFYVAPR
jgi:hemolysin III